MFTIKKEKDYLFFYAELFILKLNQATILRDFVLSKSYGCLEGPNLMCIERSKLNFFSLMQQSEGYKQGNQEAPLWSFWR